MPFLFLFVVSVIFDESVLGDRIAVTVNVVVDVIVVVVIVVIVVEVDHHVPISSLKFLKILLRTNCM